MAGRLGLEVGARSCGVLAVACTMAVTGAVAQTLTGFLELTADLSETEQEQDAGADSRQELESATRRFHFTWDQPLQPTLRLLAGGLFEETDAVTRAAIGATPTQTIDTETTLLAPYADLILASTVLSADLSFRLNEQTLKTSPAPTSTLVRKLYSSRVEWRPEGLPSVGLRLFRTEDKDRQLVLRDSTTDLLQLQSEYYPIETLRLQYNGSLQNTDDRFNGNRIETRSHSARVIYNGWLWDGRVTLNSDYSFVQRDTTVITEGLGEVGFPLTPLAGLSSIDEMPAGDPLAPAPALIDGNRAVSADVNLGLTPPGGDARPRNLGVDLGAETAINTLSVWVDRDLPAGISSSFDWTVYTSADNRTWVLHEVVGPATFGPFLNRFEVRFPGVAVRYVKVVTNPLQPGVPFATNFPEIFVTEIEATIRRPAADLEQSDGGTAHRYSLDSRVRILESPALIYELTYFLNQNPSAPGATSYTLSNGLFLSHSFSESTTAFARLSREDGEQLGRARDAWYLTASLSASPLATLRHNLVVSGRGETLDSGRVRDRSVLLFNVAELYRGVDLNFTVGRSLRDQAADRDLTSDQVNLALSLRPHRSTTINLTLRERVDGFSGGGRAAAEDVTRSEEISLALRPRPTVYLFAAHRIERRPGIDERTIDNYAFNWAPFPDGTLHVTFRYNETSRSELDAMERTVTPGLRWEVTPRTYLDLAYQELTRSSTGRKVRTDVLRGTLRVGF